MTLLNLPEQIKQFEPFQDYWEGIRERFIHLIKHQLANMQWTQTFMSTKLIEVHQSNVLDWIITIWIHQNWFQVIREKAYSIHILA